jgi:hypothetical protein
VKTYGKKGSEDEEGEKSRGRFGEKARRKATSERIGRRTGNREWE